MSNNANLSINTIAKLLNVTPIARATLVVEEENTAQFTENKDDVSASQDIVKDSINKAAKILSDVAYIAKETQNPRFFEAFTELFKSVVTANKEFIETKKIAKDLSGPEPPMLEGQPATVNQLFLTTADFGRLVQQHKDKKEEPPQDGK